MNTPPFPSNLESDYQAYLAQEKIRVARQTGWLAIVLYSAFGALDLWAIPSAVHEVWSIRASVVALTLVVIGLAVWRADFLVSRYTIIIASLYIVWGFGIEGMIFLSQPEDLARNAYYAGLILVSMALYTWTYLRPMSAAMIGVLLAAAYVYIAIGIQGMLEQGQWPVLLANCYFLAAANIIGLFALNSRERFSRQAYLLKHALQRNLELTDEAKRQSDYLAEHDLLTGIPNRVRFMRRVNEMIEHVEDAGERVAIIFIDLDGFKPINDTHGHAIGDLVLTVVSERLRSCIRPSDAIGRLGGDEFAVGLELSSQHLGSVDRVAKTIADSVSAPISVEGKTLRVTASIGAALFPIHASDADALLSAADKQMYEAKRSGKASASIAPLPAESQ